MPEIRLIQPHEYAALERFLYHAVFLPSGVDSVPFDIIYEPHMYIYIKDFGSEHDVGVVAELDGELVGAAWTRIIPAYGHMDDETPELAISVLPEHRGGGIGSAMLTELFSQLRTRGCRRTSLSVQKANSAERLYRRMGYVVVDERESDYLMCKELEGLS